MNCPIDNTQLVMSDRAGIEIDYCPQCRGVWLDRGELDKIIERSFGSGQAPAAPAQPAQPVYQQQPPVQRGYPQQPVQQGYPQQPVQQGYPQQGFNPRDLFGGGQSTDQYGRKRKKENWLSELFD